MRARERPASLACHECRRKHLKCDGAMPVCARCAATATTCTYLPSRRGLRGRQQQQSDSVGTARSSQHHVGCPPPLSGSVSAASPTLSARCSVSALFTAAEKSYLIQQYYSHFHHSHPILVPRTYFDAQQYPEFLVMAVCVTGHHFASSRPPPSTLSTAVSWVMSAEAAVNTHQIQAFVLLALVFLGSHDMSRASDCLERAVQLAQEAHLDSLDVDCLQDPSTAMQRESLRRTWWELYAVDALLALLESRPPKLATQSPTVLPRVPCADDFYELGDFSRPQQTYADFESRFFLAESTQFSAHFYRIEAVDIVRRVWPLFTRNNADPHEMEAVDNAIASWPYHLPDVSCSISGIPGDSDPILLQAHLLVQVASVFLHFPRSNLPSSTPSAMDVTCLAKGPPSMENSAQHAAKSIAASRKLCNIASLPSVQDYHSPMAVCGYLLGCAVQLSVASELRTRSSHQMQRCRHRVILVLGALRCSGKAWPAAQSALQHVKPFARSVFNTACQGQSADDRTLHISDPTTRNESSEIIPQVSVTSQHNLEPNVDLALGDSPMDINWFDFFQPVDLPETFNTYDIA